mgnify:CR=1 FL=1
MAKEPDYRSNSLLRGLSILHCFNDRNPEMTLSAIAEAIEVTSSAAYRFVVTLEREGYLTRKDNRYRLAPRVMDLGYRYLASLDVYDIARLPAMRPVSQSMCRCWRDARSSMSTARSPIARWCPTCLSARGCRPIRPRWGGSC